ncbi:low molecular weight protein-tyrosine-phosphatase [Tsuneonella mangrovi]|uniref:low molecular weight protein-tyrosine-phosphatase n=1 Tax=Tsuneonella mangrovi TaxID=1982042 RepID=UPI000BA2263C|nr:low molecular weight protein-tyrosine-phosphatase [Tsuneonella mangrovi]
MSARRPAVLFVCLGNICRSPLAEAAFRREADAAGLTVEIDSAGTGNWHVGNPPDARAQEVALAAGVDISGLRARQLAAADYRRFTHIFAMDAQNLADIRARAPHDATAEMALLLDLVPGREGASVQDPYYDGEEQFEYAWADVSAAARELVAKLAG